MNDLLSSFPLYMQGIGITLLLSLGSLLFGASFALVISVTKALRWKLTKVFDALVWFICGTPLLVQIFLIYFGLAQFEWLRDSVAWSVLREPFFCALLALTLNTACYSSVLFTSAMRSIPKHEVQTAYALGLTPWQALKAIVLPRAFINVLPAYSNELIIIVKNTALVSTITMLDVMGVTQMMIAVSFQSIKWYAVAGSIYLILNGSLLFMYHYMQRFFRKRSCSNNKRPITVNIA